jgi:hypothetical protein
MLAAGLFRQPAPDRALMVVAIIGRWVLTDRDSVAVVVVDRGPRQIAAAALAPGDSCSLFPFSMGWCHREPGGNRNNTLGPRRIIPRGLPLPSEGSIHFLIWIEFLISLIVGISIDAWASS